MSIQRREVYLVLKKLPDGRVIGTVANSRW